MTVNPGFGGQKFIPAMMSKIKTAREMAIENKKEIDIQVDGGINLDNILDVKNAGANILVVGSEIFKSAYPEDIINKIKNII
jgi:ribulose-phosphate 3-epimerase